MKKRPTRTVLHHLDGNQGNRSRANVRVLDAATSQPADILTRPCRFCQAPVPQQHAGQVREFCDSRHRAAYREQERQRAIVLALEAMDEMRGHMEAGLARMDGVETLLRRFLKKAVPGTVKEK